MRSKKTWLFALFLLLVGLGTLITLKRPVTSQRQVNARNFSVPAATPSRSLAQKEPSLERSAAGRFSTWLHQFENSSAAARSTLELEGIELAAARRAELRQLIQTDPRRALEVALSAAARRSVPASIRPLLEERVSGRGDYLVVGSLPVSAEGAMKASGVTRRAVFGDRTLEAFVYGRRVIEKSHSQLPLHGIALDGMMAVTESPLRLLEPGEEPDPSKKKLAEICEISGKTANTSLALTAADSPVAVEVGDEIHYLCSAGHILLLEKKLIAEESDFYDVTPPPVTFLARGPVIDSPYTTGQKNVLFIRIRFANQPADYEPETGPDSNDTIAQANTFLQENSYGKTGIVGTVTPVYSLPHDEAWYSDPRNDSSGFSIQILNDARAVAAQPTAFPGNERLPAYDYTAYDFEAVRYNGSPGNFTGQAYIGMRGLWLKSDSAGALAHELGHNYGLSHANRWSPSSDDVAGPGTNAEYGDVFDTMGLAMGGRYAFNAGHRSLMGWLPDANIQTVTTSGTYRLYAFDQSTLSAGQYYLLKIRKDADRDYWGEFRQQFPDNRWTEKGLLLRWSPWSQSGGGSQLLDTQPGNNNDGANDSAVVIGRTFSDRAAGLHFTPIAKGGTSPESLDIVVNIGTFPDNHAPTATLLTSSTQVAVNQAVFFNVNATDPDGDSLAYDWEFDNGVTGPNSPTASASWSSDGWHRVLVTVSDLKGKRYLASKLIQVGSPSTLTISGHVTDNAGQPAAGVRVYNGLSGAFYRGAITDSDGNYTLTNLNPGVYPLNAASSYYSTVAPAGFSNPVTAGTPTSIDFIATEPPPAVAVVATQADVSESSSTPGVFTFSRQTEAPLSAALVVGFSVSGSAAFDGSDYFFSANGAFTFDPATGTGSLTIPAGATSAALHLNPVDDTAIEGTETATLTLVAAPGYNLVGNASEATVNIADNDAPDYYTEFFKAPAKPFDLNGHQLTFTPVSSTQYRGNVDSASHFPTDPAGGTVLSANGILQVPLTGGNADDGFWKVDLAGSTALLFGKVYGQIFINTNGSLTFNEGDPTAQGNVTTHFLIGRPRVAAYWRDLDLNAGGTISYRTLSTPGLARTVVTFQKVPFYGDPTRHADVQLELWASGLITLTWLDSSAADPIVGLSPGLGAGFAFFESDLSRYPPRPPSFATWRAALFTPAELEDPALTGETADYDHDGLSNLLEYALGRDPKTPETLPAFQSAIAENDGQNYLTLTFARSLTATDVAITPQFGSDLKTWSTVSVQVGAALPLSGDREQVTFRDTLPINGLTARFGRLEVTKP